MTLYQILLIRDAYLMLQVEANKNVDFAITSDGLRAKLRNELASELDRSSESVQDEIESVANRLLKTEN